jgi:PAS domain S-box-containing protein
MPVSEKTRSQTTFRVSGRRSPTAVSFRLAADGRVISWSEEAARLHGYLAEEMIGRNFVWLLPMEQVQRGESERMLRVAVESGIHESQGWRLRKDGSKFKARMTLKAIHDQRGELEGFAVTIFPVS